MRHFVKYLAVFCVVVFLTLPFLASAEEHLLPAGFLIGDQHGVSVGSDGCYSIDANDLLPGGVIYKKLVLRNLEKGQSFRLQMNVAPQNTEGMGNYLDKITLCLTLDGKEIYSGCLRGSKRSGMMENPLFLGNYGYDEAKTLEIEVAVDESAHKLREDSAAKIDWNFRAVKNEPGAPDPSTPETEVLTGDGFNVVRILSVFIVAALVIVVLLLKDRKETGDYDYKDNRDTPNSDTANTDEP